MHELSLVEGIVAQVRTLKAKHGFSRVSEVEIVCGQHHSVNGENIGFFLALEEDACFKQVQVSVVRLTKRNYCLQCDQEFDEGEAEEVACPQGHSGRSVAATRNVLHIRKLEVD